MPFLCLLGGLAVELVGLLFVGLLVVFGFVVGFLWKIKYVRCCWVYFGGVCVCCVGLSFWSVLVFAAFECWFG